LRRRPRSVARFPGAAASLYDDSPPIRCTESGGSTPGVRCARSSGRPALAALLSAFLLAACGGQGAAEGGPADIFRAFAQAAAKQDGDRLWELLSARMKKDVSRQQFTSRSSLQRLGEDYEPVASGRILLDVELEDDLALAALEGKGIGPGARAVVLRRENGKWRVQLSELDLIYGVGDLDFQVNARQEDRQSIEARAWVDGTDAPVKHRKGGLLTSLLVRPREKLGRGRHSVVGYVEAGERSGVIAWTFER
jgi:hypothetical protein